MSLAAFCFSAISVYAQQNIVVNNLSDEEKRHALDAANENLIKPSCCRKHENIGTLRSAIQGDAIIGDGAPARTVLRSLID